MDAFREMWEKLKAKTHPNLLVIQDAYVDKATGDLLLVSERVGDSLERFASRINISQHRRREICLGVARGVRYLHESLDEAHGCLNLDDMFMSEDGVVKVGGLDLSCLLSVLPVCQSSSNIDSSSPYCALERSNERSRENDAFALGVILLEILTGQRCGRLGQSLLPDACAEGESTELEIGRRRAFLDALEDEHPFKCMILGCLQDKPQKRPVLGNIYGQILISTEGVSDFENTYDLEFKKKEENRILILGLDNAGKTAILYQLKLGEVVVTIPTIGFNVETIPMGKDLNFCIWDIGGNEKLRPLWRHYWKDTHGVVFVIDSTNAEKLEEAKEVMCTLLEEELLVNCPFLILANKQDLPSAQSPEEIEEDLDDLSTRFSRQLRVCGVSGKTGEGLWEALQVMKDMIAERQGR